MSDSYNPMDCSLPGSSVHGISQARILEWVVISSTRGSSQSRYQTPISCTAGRVFTNWTTREAWGGTSGKEPLCQCRRHKRRKFDPCIGHNWARSTLKHESLSPCSSLGSRKVWTYFFCSLVPSCLVGPLNLPHQRQWQLRRAGRALSWACQGHPSVLPSTELGIGSQTEDTQSSMWPHLAQEREGHRQNKTRSWKINLPLGFSRKEHWRELPCPPPRDLPNPGLKPTSLTSPALASEFFTTSATLEEEPGRLQSMGVTKEPDTTEHAAH